MRCFQVKSNSKWQNALFLDFFKIIFDYFGAQKSDLEMQIVLGTV